MRAKDTVESLQSYSAPLEGRREKIRLDFNENVLGPSPRVLEAIRGLPAEAYGTYPEYGPIRAEYAASLNIPAENVGLFNGADAAIRAIFDAYGEPDSTFLTTTPTFGYYAPCAQLQGMSLDQVPYLEDLSYPSAAIQARLKTKPRLLFICNPNNPTGTLLPAEVILEWAQAYPATLLVIDETYVDFTGLTVLPEALKHANILTLRTLSKTTGLAALRLGFAIGSPAIIERLERVTGPYDINMFAVVAARAALADPQHTRGYIREVEAAKALTIEALSQLGLRFFAEGGNFLLVWPGKNLMHVVAELDQRGIRVRSCAGKALIGDAFRLSIGPRDVMRQFLDTFRDVLRDSPSE